MIVFSSEVFWWSPQPCSFFQLSIIIDSFSHLWLFLSATSKVKKVTWSLGINTSLRLILPHLASHRTIKHHRTAWVGRDLNTHPIPTPSCALAAPHQLSCPGPHSTQLWAPPTPLGTLCQGLTALWNWLLHYSICKLKEASLKLLGKINSNKNTINKDLGEQAELIQRG